MKHPLAGEFPDQELRPGAGGGPPPSNPGTPSRTAVTEAAWGYRHRPAVGPGLAARQDGQTQAVKAIAWRAQHRLHGRYRALLARGKTKQKVITAVGRELLGFIWAIGSELERTHTTQEVRRAA
jgi:hypothetical protein